MFNAKINVYSIRHVGFTLVTVGSRLTRTINLIQHIHSEPEVFMNLNPTVGDDTNQSNTSVIDQDCIMYW